MLAVSLGFLLIAFSFWVLQKLTSVQCTCSTLQFYLKKSDRVLFVVSHPDDECLFFSPTIRYLIKKQVEVFILCLSTGNFYGLAEQRIKEFRASCENLGISQENIICLDSFEDDPKVLWQKQAVAQVIADYTDRLNCATIFTFDQFGISGHLNHISTFTGVKHLLSANLLRSKTQVYTLKTVFLFRKYIQVFDIFFSLIFNWWNKSSVLTVATLPDYVTGYRSMLCHRSQLLWFRYLIIFFSRYMLMNTWIPLHHDSKVN